MDRQTLQAILDSKFAIPEGGDLAQLTTELEALLGSTDKFLRENSLEVLWAWAQAGHYSDDQLIALGERMAANLAIGLGEQGTDAVFLRAFSALVLAAVLIVDQRFEAGQIEGRAPFLSADQTLDWFARALACFSGEHDRRGLAGAKGWAHSIAHQADLLSDFARSSHLEADDLERLLNAVAAKITEPCNTIYHCYEDNRIVQTVIDVMRRNAIPLASLRDWLGKFAQEPGAGHWVEVCGMERFDEQANNARMNTRSFLRSLYFQLVIGSRNFRAGYLPEDYARPIAAREELAAAVIEALKAMDRYFYPREDES